jgi:CRP/FNR family transcriptional regulator, cyclic AMP receptor protein
MEETLASSTLLKTLSPAEICAIGKRCSWRHCEPQEHILEQHDRDNAVYFVMRGTVRAVIYSGDGKEIIFRNLGPGECFGEFAAIDGEPRCASIVALTRTTVALMPAGVFMELMTKHPEIGVTVATQLVKLVRGLSERVVEFSVLTVQQRVCAELIRLTNGRGQAGNTAVITPPPLHAEIAGRIATHREAVTKELNRLERAGLIEKRKGAIEIKDLAGLSDLIAPAAVGRTGGDQRPVNGLEIKRQMQPAWTPGLARR